MTKFDTYYLHRLRREFSGPLIAEAVCPGTDLPCIHSLAWGHPCDRDEAGVYECEVLLPEKPTQEQ